MPDISLFSSIDKPIPIGTVSLDDFLQDVRIGLWADAIAIIRQTKDKDSRKRAKKGLPSVTFAGTFSQRRNDGLLQASGYINIDIDNLEDASSLRTVLSYDKYVYSCFLSPSGNGLRVLFKVNPKRFKDTYYSIAAYLSSEYNLPSDPQSQVISRSYYVTYDPEIYISKENIPQFPPVKVKETKEKHEPFVQSDFDEIIKQIVDRGVNMTEVYSDWINIGIALCSKFGESGREYFHAVSSTYGNYNQAQSEKLYDYFVSRYKDEGDGTCHISIGTFYWHCKQHGIEIISENTRSVKTKVIYWKGMGRTIPNIIENFKNEGIDDVDELVREVYESNDFHEGLELVDKVEMYVKTLQLKINEITKRVEFPNGSILSSRDYNTVFINAKRKFANLHESIFDKIVYSECVEMYNPLSDFLKTLPIIKEGYISRIASTIINKNPAYTGYFIKKWIVSIIASIYGEHSPLVLVLTGKQSTGKTQWFRRFLPEQLRKPVDYYAESKLDREKDDEILMTQSLIVMDDEFSGKSKGESRKFNQLTSKQTFTLRVPYGRHTETYQRIAVLCGTTNSDDIIKDPHGNRRIIPVAVEDVNKGLYNSIDKTKVLAEALYHYKDGFDWQISTPDDISYLNSFSNDYKEDSIEAELIIKYYEVGEDEFLLTTEIKVFLEKETLQRLNISTISNELKRLGFVKKSTEMRIKTEVGWSVTTAKRWGVKKKYGTGAGSGVTWDV